MRKIMNVTFIKNYKGENIREGIYKKLNDPKDKICKSVLDRELALSIKKRSDC